MVEPFKRILVTPNTLTEASNLLGQHRDPEKSQLLETLRIFIDESCEIVVASAEAAKHRAIARLGLTDTALLCRVTRKTPLFTVDLELYLAASMVDPYSAINYRHFQDR